jgi:hypothetical protein
MPQRCDEGKTDLLFHVTPANAGVQLPRSREEKKKKKKKKKKLDSRVRGNDENVAASAVTR